MIYKGETHQEAEIADITEGYISNKRCFNLAYAGINQKIFSFWKSKGLVDFIEKGKWTRLSFPELIWLRVLETMRKFGCSNELMKRVYDHYFTKAKEDKLFDKRIQEQIEELKQAPSVTDIQPKINSLQLMLTPDFRAEFENHFNYFSELLIKCLHYKTETGIVIFEDGTFKEYQINENSKENNDNAFYSNKPRIIIPITHYITEFLESETKIEFLGQSGLLDEDELRVIKEMRIQNVKSITISFREKDHRIEKIVSDKHGIIQGDEAKRIMKLLGLKNYEGIELITRDHKTISFKHTNKKIFKDSV